MSTRQQLKRLQLPVQRRLPCLVTLAPLCNDLWWCRMRHLHLQLHYLQLSTVNSLRNYMPMLANSDSSAAADKVTLINNCVYAACCLSLSANYTQHSIGNRKQCKQTHTRTQCSAIAGVKLCTGQSKWRRKIFRRHIWSKWKAKEEKEGVGHSLIKDTWLKLQANMA